MNFKWEEKYNTGIDEIDNQHKRLVEIINKLSNPEIIEDEKFILNELVEYANEHFSDEMRFFMIFNFPEAVDHKKLHDKFVKEVNGLIDSACGKNDYLKIKNFLIDWFRNHILASDMKFRDYLKLNDYYFK